MSGRPLCLVLVFPNDLNAIPKERGEPHIITASLPFEVKISHVKKINYRTGRACSTDNPVVTEIKF